MWILLLFMWLGSKIQFKIQLILGKAIGKLLYLVLKKFKKIATINISYCFPDKNKAQVNSLVKQHFKAIGISIFEASNAYFASNNKIKKIVIINNEHHLIKALNEKQSIILFTAHFTPLMLSARVMLLKHKIANIYRPQNNKLFDRIMCYSYTKHGATMIKANSRSILKALHKKIPIWYAPDQDLGEKNSVFAPFFNRQTATVSATSRLAKIKNTVIIPYFFTRTANGYEANFQAPIKNYPSNNAITDATKTNKIIEKQILKAPEQYIWIHKRFKTRPKGENYIYKNIS